jgi:hypothetical protein
MACSVARASKIDRSEDKLHDFHGGPQTTSQLENINCDRKQYEDFIKPFGYIRKWSLISSFDSENCLTIDGKQNCSNQQCKSVICNNALRLSAIFAITIAAVGVLLC